MHPKSQLYMSSIQEKYQNILSAIALKLGACGRPSDSVKLLAVCKGQPLESLLELKKLGQEDFGENYVQEWKEKKRQMAAPVRWHFTGRLQTNKVKELVGEIFLFHSIDRLALAQKIDQVASARGVVCQGLVEVSLAGEEQKGGVPVNQLEDFLKQLNSLNHLQLTGLMTLPPLAEDPENSRRYFRQLREIFFDLNQKSIYKSPLHELSMGMSHDFLVAIEEGATWVRVGRALFSG